MCEMAPILISSDDVPSALHKKAVDVGQDLKVLRIRGIDVEVLNHMWFLTISTFESEDACFREEGGDMEEDLLQSCITSGKVEMTIVHVAIAAVIEPGNGSLEKTSQVVVVPAHVPEVRWIRAVSPDRNPDLNMADKRREVWMATKPCRALIKTIDRPF